VREAVVLAIGLQNRELNAFITEHSGFTPLSPGAGAGAVVAALGKAFGRLRGMRSAKQKQEEQRHALVGGGGPASLADRAGGVAGEVGGAESEEQQARGAFELQLQFLNAAILAGTSSRGGGEGGVRRFDIVGRQLLRDFRKNFCDALLRPALLQVSEEGARAATANARWMVAVLGREGHHSMQVGECGIVWRESLSRGAPLHAAPL
jgi:hypothetical protein